VKPPLAVVLIPIVAVELEPTPGNVSVVAVVVVLGQGVVVGASVDGGVIVGVA